MSGIKEKISDVLANFEKGQLLGLDIGLSSIKMARMVPAGKTFKLEEYASFNIPVDSIVDDEIQKPTDVAEAISLCFSQLKTRKKLVCIGIDGPNTMTKRMQVPDGEPEDVEDNVLWESEQYIPFSVDEAEIDFSVLKIQEEKQVQDVLVAVAKSDIAEHFQKVVRSGGLFPKIVDLKVIALTNIFEIAYAATLETLSEEGAIIIDYGAQKTTIVVYKNGGPLLTKEIGYGGQQVTEEIQRRMGLSAAESEDLKTMGDESGNLPEEIVVIIEEQIQRCLEEIKKVLNFYITAGSSEQVRYCFITGGSSLLPGFSEHLSSMIGIDAEFFNPFNGIDFNRKKFNEEQLTQIAATGSVAMGLGLRSIK